MELANLLQHFRSGEKTAKAPKKTKDSLCKNCHSVSFLNIRKLLPEVTQKNLSQPLQVTPLSNWALRKKLFTVNIIMPN